MEEDHRCIMIIGGIKIFLPRSQTEASISVSGATEEGQHVNVLNLHRIDLARKYHTHLQREIKKEEAR
jgi:hypothetical protein